MNVKQRFRKGSIQRWVMDRTVQYGLRLLALSPFVIFTAILTRSGYRWMPATIGVGMLVVGIGLTLFGSYAVQDTGDELRSLMDE